MFSKNIKIKKARALLVEKYQYSTSKCWAWVRSSERTAYGSLLSSGSLHADRPGAPHRKARRLYMWWAVEAH